MTTLAVFLWLTATVGHFLLTSRFVRRVLPSDASFDETAFATVLGGVGTLSVVFHVLAASTGLNLTSGLVTLLCLHVLIWTLTPSAVPDVRSAARSSRSLAVAETLAAAALAGILFTWIDIASQSSAVVGTDAAHYHVPVAVNLARGANLFGLPATAHFYPMASSLLEAWFMLPVTGPLIVDLAMCLPFLLLAASMNWIFRLTTGESGLGWATWVVVAVFSAPLFRLSSLVSADLWFASAFVALIAVLTSVWARRTWRVSDVALSGLALGLLTGTKTTGSAAAALLLGTYLVVVIIRTVVFRDRRRLWPSPRFASALVGTTLMVAAGGIWLVRNWQQFGSPIAPWGLTIFGVSVFSGDSPQPTTYLSVLGDLQTDPTYDLAKRLSRFVRIWIGEWSFRRFG